MAKFEVETGDSCRSSVITVKETHHNLQINYSGLQVGGVDEWGMVLDLLFSWISTYFLI